MNLLTTAVREVFGLFVDDGIFALAILGWCALGWLVLPHLALAPSCDGVVLFLGLSAILVESAWRRSRS